MSALPTSYEYYEGTSIVAGLNVDGPQLTLNGRNITVFSGAMQYFRVPPEYWRDRLRKLRAAGLNTVETYIPWNLHEPQEGNFDFGTGGSDWSEFLDVQRFLEIAREEDLFAIVRPGPYICAEWEFGGLPSWLLRYEGLKLRTSEMTFVAKVERYFNVLLPILALLQFMKGGPIIGVQIENEYGTVGKLGRPITPDKEYLELLRKIVISNGITELLFTSDWSSEDGDIGTLPGVLFQTANLGADPEKELEALLKLQPNKPLIVMELWTGWFDHWGESHYVDDVDFFSDTLERILKFPASVNMYMFCGGTSFGFMNGANVMYASPDGEDYLPDTSSYDYGAPITEDGDYTTKYVRVKELIKKYEIVKTRIPAVPAVTVKKAYRHLLIKKQLSFWEILDQIPNKIDNSTLVPMELLPNLNNNSGQSYGYIVYRKENFDIHLNSTLTIKGRVSDTIMVLINGFLASKPLTSVGDFNDFGYWRWNNSELKLGIQPVKSATIDLIVENWGRVNFGNLDQFKQYKGLWQGGVFIGDVELTDFTIFPLEFKKSFNANLKNFHAPITPWLPAPAIYKATLTLRERFDTYIDMSHWTKGIVIVNDFVIGRYASIGPQHTLFLPAPLLKKGKNTFMVFEHFYPATRIRFRTSPIMTVEVSAEVAPIVMANISAMIAENKSTTVTANGPVVTAKGPMVTTQEPGGTRKSAQFKSSAKSDFVLSRFEPNLCYTLIIFCFYYYCC